MQPRRPIQRVLLVIAVVSYLAAVACAVAALYLGAGYGDPIAAALMASVVFFVGAGVVLHVIAKTNLPDLKIRK